MKKILRLLPQPTFRIFYLMSNRIDFSKTLFHCSSIGIIMGAPDKKTPMQEYLDAIQARKAKEEEYQIKFVDTGKEDTKQAVACKKKIEYYANKLIDLELIKNDEVLSSGCKTYLLSVYASEKYGKWSASKDKGNKFTNKGHLCELDSIELISKLDGKIYEKNEERVENEYLTGIPDIFEGESIYNATKIIDIKTSWDIETFFSNLGKRLKSVYWWQLQGYMAITGAKEGEVSFCLVDTPESIINDEKYRLFRRMDVATEENPAYKAAAFELENNLTFGDMPIEDRRMRFKVERDDEAIAKLYRKIDTCRKYLEEIEKMHLENTYDTCNSVSLDEEIDV